MNLELILTDELINELRSRYSSIIFCGVYNKPPNEDGDYTLKMVWDGKRIEANYACDVMKHVVNDDDISIKEIPEREWI